MAISAENQRLLNRYRYLSERVAGAYKAEEEARKITIVKGSEYRTAIFWHGEMMKFVNTLTEEQMNVIELEERDRICGLLCQ
ncbi:hypothetical protein C4565_00445 [Candidatus Parcubacteria bacterium]|nr:MAG: hypothetical protein C4565_00445 [Candidatus Parcubacteria bacterium]